MGDHEHSTTVAADPDELLDYLSDVHNLPDHFAAVREAEPTGEASHGGEEVHVVAEVEGTRREGEAWIDADKEKRTLRVGLGGAERLLTGSSDVAADRVLRRDLDDDDPGAVGVGDPHLVETPGFAAGFAQHAGTLGEEFGVGGGEVAHLQPQPQSRAVRGRGVGVRGHLEQPVAQEEDRAAGEFAIHRQPEDVAVEAQRGVGIGGPQGRTAAQDLPAARG